VLSGLRERLLSPDMIAEFMKAFAHEVAQTRRQKSETRAQLESLLADTERRLKGVLRAIEEGAWSDSLRDRLRELETRKAALDRQRTDLGSLVPVVQIHRKRCVDDTWRLDAPL
jgi:site-specific DNA recombinase